MGLSRICTRGVKAGISNAERHPAAACFTTEGELAAEEEHGVCLSRLRQRVHREVPIQGARLFPVFFLSGWRREFHGYEGIVVDGFGLFRGHREALL
jgi:hypothetical protein